MKVVIPQGETLYVTLEDTDGEFRISYGGEVAEALTVHVDLPDTTGRQGVIYEERFGSDAVVPSPWTPHLEVDGRWVIVRGDQQYTVRGQVVSYRAYLSARNDADVLNRRQAK